MIWCLLMIRLKLWIWGKETTDVMWLAPLCRWEKWNSRWLNKSVKVIQFKSFVISNFWVNSSKYLHRKNEKKGFWQRQREEFGFKEIGHLRWGDGPLRNCLYSWASPGTSSRSFILKLKAISGRTSVQSCVDFRFYPFLWDFFQFWLSMQTTFAQAVDHLLHSMFICIPFLFITSLGETIILLKWFVCF